MNKGVLLLFFSISLFFSLTWITGQRFIGGGDVGIPLLYPSNILHVISSSWWGNQETGSVNPMSYAAIPFYLILSFLEKLALPTFILQKLFIFTTVFIGFISVYLLAKKFLKSTHQSVIAALFYNCNLLTLSIWHRGVHNAMIFTAFAPLSLLILMDAVTKKSATRLIIFGFVSGIFSYVFGSPALIISSFLLWGWYLLGHLIASPKRKTTFILIFLSVLIWFSANFWWILHFIISSKSTLNQFTSLELQSRVVDVVSALKPQNDPNYIFRLISKFQLYDIHDFGLIYSQPILILLSWLPVLIIVSTSLKRIFRLNNVWRWSFSLFILVLFISKGVNPPYGWLIKYLYNHYSFLAPLRNSYEKIGLILIIPASLLFAQGVNQVKNFYLRYFLIFLSCFVLVWPLWSANVFMGDTQRGLITVPDYYSQANDYIKTRNSSNRILHLPLAQGESIDYDWGYTGIEPSQLFFSGSSISYSTGLPLLDIQHNETLRLIHERKNQDFAKQLSNLNIGWIVVHNEVESRQRGLEQASQLSDWLRSLNYLNQKTSIGPLDIWEVTPNILSGQLFIAKDLTYISNLDAQSYPSSWNYKISPNSVFDHKSTGLESKYIYFPYHKIYYWPNSLSGNENSLKELPYVKYFPDSPFYKIIRFKEKLFSSFGQDEASCFDFAGKRLVESVKIGSTHLKDYEDQLSKCEFAGANLQIFQQTDTEKFFTLASKLYRQQYVLDQNFDSQADNTRKYLKNFMGRVGVSPIFTDTFSTPSGAIAYWYKAPVGDYQIGFTSLQNEKYYYPPQIFQVDDHPVALTSLISAQAKNLSITSTDNPHEIHFTKPVYQPVAESYSEKEIALDTDNKTDISLQLKNLSPRQKYIISFDYFVEYGAGPVVRVDQDADPLDEYQKPRPPILDFVPAGNYVHYWQNRNYIYIPSANANLAKLTLSTVPWNNCEDFFSRIKCKDEQIKAQFNKKSLVHIRNLKITPDFTIDPSLIASNSAQLGTADLKFENISSTKIKINITNQHPPFLIGFASTYHDGWQIQDSNGREIDTNHMQINSYANGWLINKELPETVYLVFSVEKYKTYGIIISATSFILLSGLCFYIQKKLH